MSMTFQGINVLLLDGYGRQLPTIMRQLHDLGCEITTLNCSKLDIGYTSRYPKKKLLEPDTRHNSDALEAVLDREIFSGKYDVVFPMLEPSTEILTKKASEYEKYVRIIAAPYDAFMRAYDKQVTMCACMDNDIPCPITKRDEESLDAYIEKVGFPIVVKPRKGTGSIGFHCIRTQEELNVLLQSEDFRIEENVIQQYIPQTDTQYGTYIILDKNHNVKTAMVTDKARWYPIDGGAACLSRTVDRPDIIEDSIRLLKALKWQGFAQLDFIGDPRDGVAKCMEINGRITASMKICQHVGIPVVKQLLQYAFGEEVEAYTKPIPLDYRLRYSQTDFMWFLKSPRRFSFRPSWFSNKRTTDFIWSIKDPIPYFSYTLSHILSLREDMKKRNRKI